MTEYDQSRVGVPWVPQSEEEGQSPAALYKLRQTLPVRPIAFNVQVNENDLMPGAVWPPPRLQERTQRFELLWRVSNGNLSDFVEVPMPVNRVSSLLNYKAALLTSNEPMSSQFTTKNLAEVIQMSSYNINLYGRGLIFTLEGSTPIAPDTRNVWPLFGEGWVVIQPFVSQDATTSQPDRATIVVLKGDMAQMFTREYSAGDSLRMQGAQLGSVLEQSEAMPAKYDHCDALVMRGGWGRSLVEDLITVQVKMAIRSAGIEYVIDSNERPIFAAYVNNADVSTVADLQGVDVGNPGSKAVTPQTLKNLSSSLKNHDVLMFVDGLQDAEYIQWDGDMAGPFAYLQRLEMEWTSITGMAPVEIADSGDAPSGTALARRQAALTLKTLPEYRAIKSALESQVDDLEWDWVDSLADSSDDPEGEVAEPFDDEDPTEGDKPPAFAATEAS